MEVEIRKGDFTCVHAETLVLFHFEQEEKLLEVTAAVNDVAEAIVGRVLESGDFRGEHLEHVLLFPQGSQLTPRILLMGLGKREEFSAHNLREAAAQALKALRDRRQSRAVLPIPLDREFPLGLGDTAEACVLGGMLGLYQFTELRTRELEKIKKFECLTILSPKKSRELETSVARAKTIAQGVYLPGIWSPCRPTWRPRGFWQLGLKRWRLRRAWNFTSSMRKRPESWEWAPFLRWRKEATNRV